MYEGEELRVEVAPLRAEEAQLFGGRVRRIDRRAELCVLCVDVLEALRLRQQQGGGSHAVAHAELHDLRFQRRDHLPRRVHPLL